MWITLWIVHYQAFHFHTYSHILLLIYLWKLFIFIQNLLCIFWYLIKSLSRRTKSISIIAFLRNLDIKILYSNVNSYYIILLIPIISKICKTIIIGIPI